MSDNGDSVRSAKELQEENEVLRAMLNRATQPRDQVHANQAEKYLFKIEKLELDIKREKDLRVKLQSLLAESRDQFDLVMLRKDSENKRLGEQSVKQQNELELLRTRLRESEGLVAVLKRENTHLRSENGKLQTQLNNHHHASSSSSANGMMAPPDYGGSRSIAQTQRGATPSRHFSHVLRSLSPMALPINGGAIGSPAPKQTPRGSHNNAGHNAPPTPRDRSRSPNSSNAAPGHHQQRRGSNATGGQPSASSSSVVDCRVGSRVTWNGHQCTVRFVGSVHCLGEGHWLGLELNGAGGGEHNGTLGGVKYFSAPPKGGVFCKLAEVSRPVEPKPAVPALPLPPPPPAAEEAKPAEKKPPVPRLSARARTPPRENGEEDNGNGGDTKRTPGRKASASPNKPGPKKAEEKKPTKQPQQKPAAKKSLAPNKKAGASSPKKNEDSTQEEEPKKAEEAKKDEEPRKEEESKQEDDAPKGEEVVNKADEEPKNEGENKKQDETKTEEAASPNAANNNDADDNERKTEEEAPAEKEPETAALAPATDESAPAQELKEGEHKAETAAPEEITVGVVYTKPRAPQSDGDDAPKPEVLADEFNVLLDDATTLDAIIEKSRAALGGAEVFASGVVLALWLPPQEGEGEQESLPLDSNEAWQRHAKAAATNEGRRLNVVVRVIASSAEPQQEVETAPSTGNGASVEAAEKKEAPAEKIADEARQQQEDPEEKPEEGEESQ